MIAIHQSVSQSFTQSDTKNFKRSGLYLWNLHSHTHTHHVNSHSFSERTTQFNVEDEVEEEEDGEEVKRRIDLQK